MSPGGSALTPAARVRVSSPGGAYRQEPGPTLGPPPVGGRTGSTPVLEEWNAVVAEGYFLPPKPLKRALKRSTRPAVSMIRCLPV